ncbi:hypothetical protein BKA70DRAFT_1400936 [Coprinopsis sp. MPI-PUGE-AT-0042]|nr:hypothetical protein BKA70DRAFT_1400936 [Coprinopsis sp. MPI-PUGE-AT-0042]
MYARTATRTKNHDEANTKRTRKEELEKTHVQPRRLQPNIIIRLATSASFSNNLACLDESPCVLLQTSCCDPAWWNSDPSSNPQIAAVPWTGTGIEAVFVVGVLELVRVDLFFAAFGFGFGYDFFREGLRELDRCRIVWRIRRLLRGASSQQERRWWMLWYRNPSTEVPAHSPMVKDIIPSPSLRGAPVSPREPIESVQTTSKDPRARRVESEKQSWKKSQTESRDAERSSVKSESALQRSPAY